MRTVAVLAATLLVAGMAGQAHAAAARTTATVTRATATRAISNALSADLDLNDLCNNLKTKGEANDLDLNDLCNNLKAKGEANQDMPEMLFNNNNKVQEMFKRVAEYYTGMFRPKWSLGRRMGSIGEDAGSQLSGSWSKRASGKKQRTSRNANDANAKAFAKFAALFAKVKGVSQFSGGVPIDPEVGEAAVANFFAKFGGITGAESALASGDELASPGNQASLRGGARQLWSSKSGIANISFSDKRCCCQAGCPAGNYLCIAACHAFGGACSMRGASVPDGASTAQRDACRGASTSWTGRLTCPASCPAHT